MRILSGYELTQAEHWLEEARQVALRSRCSSSRCGTVIVTQHGQERIIGSGFNAPPTGLQEGRYSKNPCRCVRKEELKPLFKSDKTGCMHAEQVAIMDALKNDPTSLQFSRLYFVRLDDNDQIKPSGNPYCTICSKMTLQAGIPEFALIHHGGNVTVYDSFEYNELSFQYNG